MRDVRGLVADVRATLPALERQRGPVVIPLPGGPRKLIPERGRGPTVLGVMSDAHPDVRSRWLNGTPDASG
jgi:hypothetical protein